MQERQKNHEVEAIHFGDVLVPNDDAHNRRNVGHNCDYNNSAHHDFEKK